MPSFTMALYQVIDLKPADMTVEEWLGLSEYPIYDEAHRHVLNEKIMNHFMYQEIGTETIAQFRFRMANRLNEVMPLYNQLYESTLLKFDPLLTMVVDNEAKNTSDQDSTGKTKSLTDSTVNSESKGVSSSFPQVALSPNKDYATAGTDAISGTTTKGEIGEESEANAKAVNDSTSRTTGYQGSPAALLQQFRASMINVDMLIIAELDPLFMMVWNNGDEYSQTQGSRFIY